MKYIFFDLETTGLARTSDILEFGAIVCNQDIIPVSFHHEYFLTDKPVPQSAVNVHGLTQQKLEFLANRDFMAAAPDIANLITAKDTYVCGHNIVNYDLPVLKSNLSRAGISLDTAKLSCMDTLLISKEKVPGPHKLDILTSNLLRKRGMSMKEINAAFDSLVESSGLDIDTEMRYHSALYDSFLSWCTFLQLG